MSPKISWAKCSGFLVAVYSQREHSNPRNIQPPSTWYFPTLPAPSLQSAACQSVVFFLGSAIVSDFYSPCIAVPWFPMLSWLVSSSRSKTFRANGMLRTLVLKSSLFFPHIWLSLMAQSRQDTPGLKRHWEAWSMAPHYRLTLSGAVNYKNLVMFLW
jgi:hypothetical protein